MAAPLSDARLSVLPLMAGLYLTPIDLQRFMPDSFKTGFFETVPPVSIRSRASALMRKFAPLSFRCCLGHWRPFGVTLRIFPPWILVS